MLMLRLIVSLLLLRNQKCFFLAILRTSKQFPNELKDINHTHTKKDRIKDVEPLLIPFDFELKVKNPELGIGSRKKLFVCLGLTSYHSNHRVKYVFFLLSLRLGVNFTNILRAAFTHSDPESTKKTVELSEFCAFGICERKSCA